MGTTASVGTPLLKPNATVDKPVAPIAPIGEPADGSGPSGGWVTRPVSTYCTPYLYGSLLQRKKTWRGFVLHVFEAPGTGCT